MLQIILSIFAILRDFDDVTAPSLWVGKNFVADVMHNYILGLAISITVVVSDITNLPILS